jgi:hypothetical protein
VKSAKQHFDPQAFEHAPARLRIKCYGKKLAKFPPSNRFPERPSRAGIAYRVAASPRRRRPSRPLVYPDAQAGGRCLTRHRDAVRSQEHAVRLALLDRAAAPSQPLTAGLRGRRFIYPSPAAVACRNRAAQINPAARLRPAPIWT